MRETSEQAALVEFEGERQLAPQFNGVSVIVPAYNEEHGIRLVLEQILEVLAEGKIPHELIVVDDGSHDRTVEIARGITGVRVARHRLNRGYGAALKTGIRLARFELVCITDADGTYPNGRIPDLVAAMTAGGPDMVVGARIGDNVSIPLLRRPAKWAITRLSQAVAGEQIPDINSGLRIFKKSIAMRFFNMLPEGFSFTTTFTLGLLVNDYNVEYLPIEYYPRLGRSKIRPVRDTLNFIQLVLRIGLYFSPLKIFLPMSASLFLLGLIWGAISYFAFGRIADASAAVILMTAVQVAVVGFLADLINRRLPNYHKPAEPEEKWEE